MMAQQVSGIPFSPYTGGAGYGRYVGAGAVMTWGVASFGPGRTGVAAEARAVKFSVVGGTIHVLTNGMAPDATVGLRYEPAAGPHVIENSATELAAWRMYVPAGVEVYAEFGN
jgi:hypothetical protein